MKRTVEVKSLKSLLHPEVQRLLASTTDELMSMLVGHAHAVLGEACELAIGHVRKRLEESHVAEPERRPDGEKARRAVPERAGRQLSKARGVSRDGHRVRDPKGAQRGTAATEKVAAKAKPVTMACGKCGAPGFNARGCGKTHNVAAETKPSISTPRGHHVAGAVVGDEPPPYHARTGSRESRPQLPRAKASSDDDEEPVELLVTDSGDGDGDDFVRRGRRRRQRPRSRTIAAKHLTREAIRIGALMYPTVDDDVRPATRGECRDQERPCPYVACKHHLYLDVNPETGSIKINFPDLEPWELVETCTLDVADRGGITLEEVGGIMNITRERVRQLEVLGLHAVKSEHAARGIDSTALAHFARGDNTEER